jgi:uncharacterized protein
MKDLLEYIVTNIVNNKEAVEIVEERENGNVNLNLTVDPADMGLVIGKGGQTIHAIRKLLTVRAIGENVRVNLRLDEPAGGRPERPTSEEENTTEESADKEEVSEESEEVEKDDETPEKEDSEETSESDKE